MNRQEEASVQLVLTEDQELLAKTALDFTRTHSPVSRMRARYPAVSRMTRIPRLFFDQRRRRFGSRGPDLVEKGASRSVVTD